MVFYAVKFANFLVVYWDLVDSNPQEICNKVFGYFQNVLEYPEKTNIAGIFKEYSRNAVCTLSDCQDLKQFKCFI